MRRIAVRCATSINRCSGPSSLTATRWQQQLGVGLRGSGHGITSVLAIRSLTSTIQSPLTRNNIRFGVSRQPTSTRSSWEEEGSPQLLSLSSPSLSWRMDRWSIPLSLRRMATGTPPNSRSPYSLSNYATSSSSQSASAAANATENNNNDSQRQQEGKEGDDMHPYLYVARQSVIVLGSLYSCQVLMGLTLPPLISVTPT
jgi:hypothetical protein